MKFIENLERRFGRYAIRNLMLYMSILFAAGLVIQMIRPELYFQYLMLDPSAVLKGQIWRLFTFLVYPPSTNILWCALLCYIYFSIGQMLERLWGAFRFNLYIFVGLLAMIIGIFICYFIWGENVLIYSISMSNSLWLSMLLAVAAMFPDAQFLLMFIIPVKARWIGYFYGAMLAYEFITSNGAGRVMLVMSILNFLLFFFLTRNVREAFRQTIRRREFQSSMKRGQQAAHAGASRPGRQGQPKHRCSVCGRTELDDPTLEFRYCSRCEGSHEYCMEHLYTHVHVTSGNHSDHN